MTDLAFIMLFTVLTVVFIVFLAWIAAHETMRANDTIARWRSLEARARKRGDIEAADECAARAAFHELPWYRAARPRFWKYL